MTASHCFTSCSTRLLHGSFNGHIRAAHFLPIRAYLCFKFPVSRTLQSTTITTGVSFLKNSLSTADPRCHRPSNGALITSACHPVVPPTPRARTSGDILASLAIAVAIPVVAGMLASIFNAANVKWYDRLRKPDWNPPAWVFGAAWGVLYAVMGFASWLIWIHGGWDIHGYALMLYAVQLALNLAWPMIFFGAKKMGLALIDISALWLSLFACIRAFQAINPLAARLLKRHSSLSLSLAFKELTELEEVFGERRSLKPTYKFVTTAQETFSKEKSSPRLLI
ncbi:hypothetical protein GOP47_0000423 [Adiantum capillus-veneris]|uniref:Uncharacterized protein n=1 Tax=Adiantum capillus-veneris TaxID=13818 RepID=A0A9D4VDA6_ADICA|nr:hypothetical protein GOP47_0000423 [Adiantum capillus-veneris]